MRRAIYEDDVIKLLDKGWKSGMYPVASNIHALPSAQPEPCEDFVKVVRCKKCRYVHCDKEFDNYWCNRMSGTFMVEAEGFCKWGR